MNGEILKVLGSSRQEHNWGSYLQWVQNRFFKEALLETESELEAGIISAIA